MDQKIVLLAALAALTAAATGCNGLATLGGHYEGVLFARGTAAPAGSQQPVKADITLAAKGREATATVVDLHQNPLVVIKFSGIQKKSLKIEIKGLLDQPTAFKAGDSCFYLKGDELSGRFCFEARELVLELTQKGVGEVFSLAVDRFAKVDAFAPATPFDTTLTQAVKTAFEKNFDNLIELQNVVQARLTQALARKNLLPGVSFSSGTALLVQDISGILASIGDLAPFLLPTRWFQAHEAGDKLDAEQDTLVLLRADTATQVEGFAYVLERDQTIRDFYAATLAQAQDAADDIKERVDVGQFPEGTDDAIDEVVNNIQQAIVGLDLVVAEDKTALGQTLGLPNPASLRNLRIDEEAMPVEQARSYTHDELVQRALDASFELRQIDSLISVAKYQKKERYFNFLDPAGDYTGKLGVGIGDYVRIGSSQVAALEIQKLKTAQTVTIKAENALIEYNNAVAAYHVAAEGMAISQDIMQRMMGHVDNGASVDLATLVATFQDYLAQEVNVQNAIASYRVARAKIDRFLMQGFYSRLALPKQ